MSATITDADLLAYLDEMLPDARATELERLLRECTSLQQRAAELIRQRDQGGRTVGEIWRRHRLSCPGRSELASHLLGLLEPVVAGYVDFHLNIIGCRVCQANREDLQSRQANLQAERASQTRRERYFESSAGILRSRRDDE